MKSTLFELLVFLIVAVLGVNYAKAEVDEFQQEIILRIVLETVAKTNYRYVRFFGKPASCVEIEDIVFEGNPYDKPAEPDPETLARTVMNAIVSRFPAISYFGVKVEGAARFVEVWRWEKGKVEIFTQP